MQTISATCDREEVALAEQVARAMVGLIGIALNSANMIRARELAESIIARFEHYPEAGIQKTVEFARMLLQLPES